MFIRYYSFLFKFYHSFIMSNHVNENLYVMHIFIGISNLSKNEMCAKEVFSTEVQN